jgi:hypothetical protein
MNEQSTPSPSLNPANPPRLIGALLAGFNLVARKAYLLILPMALDLLLWFGPHLKLSTLLGPTIQEMIDTPVASGVDSTPFFDLLHSFQTFVGRFNLLAWLSVRPLGIPSLMSMVFPVHTPFGNPYSYEIKSIVQAFLGMLLFGLLGLFFASLYYGMVARATANPKENFTFGRTVWEFLQIFSLVVLILILTIAISIPILIFSWLLFLINQAVASIALTVCAFLLLWVIIPFVFTPHGIYAAGQNLFRSLLISWRLVRAFYPGVTLFLLAVLVISELMQRLWIGAPDNSWLMLASIFGNAFISTALLAASFVYYRSAAAWARNPRKDPISRQITL